jgi:hypothetical protein
LEEVKKGRYRNEKEGGEGRGRREIILV